MTEKDNEVTEQVAKTKKKKEKKPKKKFFERRFSWYLVVILGGILIVIIGMLLGIPRGINDRVSLAETQAAPKIQSQLESARTDIAEGRYSVALTRLDWILDEMSAYLTEEELAEVGGTVYANPADDQFFRDGNTSLYTHANRTGNHADTGLSGVRKIFSTPPNSILTRNPGMRLSQPWNRYGIKTWNTGLSKWDGMLYVALRNRGIQKILMEGSLEPGIYDLTQAERFAPLDNQAEAYRTWARFYITGASYWDVDWTQVIYYFEQVYTNFPGMRDGSNMTATERYKKALLNYGLQLGRRRAIL